MSYNKILFRKFDGNRNEKKNIYLGMSIFWYNFIKPKYQDRAKLCYIDTDSFIIHIKTEDFYEDTANDV